MPRMPSTGAAATVETVAGRAIATATAEEGTT
jgi:hypothetical protein